jgi:uncharacterized protein RhaS with RHS repeats
MQARYYDPVMGRFLSVDPVGYSGATDTGMFGRYSYVGNDPVNLIDPFGMQSACPNNDCPVGISSEIPGANEVEEKFPSDVTDSELNAAVVSVLDSVNPTSVSTDSEIAGLVILTEGGNLETRVTDTQSCASGAACASNPFKNASSVVPEGAAVLADFHTHGAAPPSNPSAFSAFSSGDISGINGTGASGKYPAYRAGFLATPQGQGFRKDPGPTAPTSIGPIKN